MMRGEGRKPQRHISRTGGKRAIAAACLASVAAACGGSTVGPRGSAQWALRVEPIESPAGAASAQPQLTTSPQGVVLSWLETVGSQTRLLFAERLNAPRGGRPAGAPWTTPRLVTAGENLFVNWADLPSVARLHDARGTLVAHWLQRIGAQTSGYTLELATSIDDGRTWSPPFSPHHDATNTQHGFASLFEVPGSPTRFGLVWLDGRATTPAQNPDDDATGEMMLRSAQYDAAWTQQVDEVVDSRVCDCCPTAAAVTIDGVVVAFRNRSADEIRDIFVSRLVGGRWTNPIAVHNDGWRIDGCPVNGPALSAGGRTVAVAWFTAADDEGRAFVAFSTDGGGTFGPPIRVDDAGALGRVDVELLGDGSAVVSWIELAHRRAALMARRVAQSGERSAATTIAELTSNRGSVFPRMAAAGGELVFAWADADSLRVRTAVAHVP